MSQHRIENSEKRNRVSRAFTLIELIVVCAIIVMIASLILANHGRFGGQVLLQNFAYDVALSLRQAQVYGISVQRFGEASDRRFNAGYGIFIGNTPTTEYVLFADSDPLPPALPNNWYTEGSDEVRTRNSINRGYVIEKICVPAGADTSCHAVDNLHIVFLRPEPDAWISWKELGASGALNECTESSYDEGECGPSARIVMKSPRGELMSVIVYNNGQIAVDNAN